MPIVTTRFMLSLQHHTRAFFLSLSLSLSLSVSISLCMCVILRDLLCTSSSSEPLSYCLQFKINKPCTYKCRDAYQCSY